MERKEHWEKMYSKKSPLQVSWYQAEPKISLQLIEAIGYRKDAAIIDVGGGASVLVDRLLEHGYSNVSVLDLSGRALAHAKNRLGKKSAAVNWLESDATDFTPPGMYDIWHDRAVFHFLTDSGDREKYINTLTKSLRKGGHLIIATFATGGPTKCSGLDIVQYDADKIATELGIAFALQSELFEMHITPSGGEQKFEYFHFIKQQ
ncbi:MAG: class I SAM-dependent methyltransferase [Mariprofundaceae bacterium]|nr:class I SAM-dependent methyltransferase [Mariprofundaceae bacterium]